MHRIKFVSVVIIAMILSGCGGGSSDEAAAKPKFSSQVSFGDSLSDVGSYNVGLVAAIGGGQFTINDATGAPTNWTEMTAPKFGLTAPCAAQTGLDNGSGAAPGTPAGTVIPVANNSACTSYAQGGARVTNPVGVGNRFIPAVTAGFALTVPVVTQISNHLAAHGGSFNGDEIVFVMAGANDVFIQAATVVDGPTQLAAIAAMQTAATELAGYVTTEIIGKGAKYVVVMNVPDIGSTPQVTSIADPTARAQAKGLFDALVSAFNTQLATSLPDSANVMNVDAFTASGDEVANPAKYNLTNVTDVACAPNALGTTSLACNSTNLATGVSATDHYLFADTVHPTPYGHALFATYVLQEMVNKGWY